MLIFNCNGVDSDISTYLPSGVSERDFVEFITGQSYDVFSRGIVIISDDRIFVGLHKVVKTVDIVYDIRLDSGAGHLDGWIKFYNRCKVLDSLC